MSDEQRITVAEVSEGGDAGAPIDLPVVEVLTGRAFLTGKSGSGKSNTASVVAEKLLDRGFGVLIVDIEGEYYGLKEEYEILHAGADEECDIQVREEHAGKLATLALEQNVPIILDLSGFLHESDARDLLKAVARQLFAKEKKLKQPFLLVVEEIHEYVPEGGGMDECGRMLVKVAKRGRKHGLGVAGISQRPADVKKDFITQCDWLVWHRLTWQNDTRVVRRVLGEEYADAIEDLDDGEGFLMTDWSEAVRRVQFHRKETFDAGATPGLEDFERPDLKSVSDDLVSELQDISRREARREDEVARLEAELEEREQRIAELNEELAQARDMSDMAEQFARAMTEHAGGLHRPPREPRHRDVAANGSSDTGRNGTGAAGGLPDGVGATGPGDGRPGAEPDDAPSSDDEGGSSGPDGLAADEDGASADETAVGPAADGDGGVGSTTARRVREVMSPEQRAIVRDAAAAAAEPHPEPGPDDDERSSSGGNGRSTADDDGVDDGGDTKTRDANPGAASAPVTIETDGDADGLDDVADETADDERAAMAVPADALAERLREAIADLDECAREMLAAYRDVGIATPEAAHEATGASGERAAAYGHNRTLRKHGFVVHVGRGRYAYAVPSLLEALADDLDDDRRASLLATVEEAL